MKKEYLYRITLEQLDGASRPRSPPSAKSYRITLEQLDGASPETVSRQLQLGFSNHDDIFGIIDREGPGRFGSLSAHDAALFVVSLKLLGKVLMENRKNELFSVFSSHFVDFMKKVKKNPSEK